MQTRLNKNKMAHISTEDLENLRKKVVSLKGEVEHLTQENEKLQEVIYKNNKMKITKENKDLVKRVIRK